jgi:hypothetical protein
MERVFEKVGRFFRQKWQLAVLDLNSGRWIVESKASNIPYLKAENANGRHILIRPTPVVDPCYMMADDLDRHLLRRHHCRPDGSWKPGRMVVETSPGNFQVWIHSSRFLQLDEKRHWLVKMRSDPGADPKNRWGRCPGFRNRKEKYRDSKGRYPLSRLIWVDWKNEAVIPRLSPQPRGGCVVKNIFPVTIIAGETNRRRISPILWLWRAEAFLMGKSSIDCSTKDRIGPTTRISAREKAISRVRSLGQEML